MVGVGVPSLAVVVARTAPVAAGVGRGSLTRAFAALVGASRAGSRLPRSGGTSTGQSSRSHTAPMAISLLNAKVRTDLKKEKYARKAL
jgi:hypothetical protein